ncbi:MAG: SRPBCC family protein [Acidimicrobiia bacterium]
MVRPFEFDRSFDLDVDPAVAWRVLEQTGEYTRWWSWLESFDARGLQPGRATAVIRSPLGYRLYVDIDVQEVIPERRLITEVHGDLAGPARLELMPTETGSTARLWWELALRQRFLRLLLPPGRPLMEWGHDQIVARALQDFRQRALSAEAGDHRAGQRTERGVIGKLRHDRQRPDLGNEATADAEIDDAHPDPRHGPDDDGVPPRQSEGGGGGPTQ